MDKKRLERRSLGQVLDERAARIVVALAAHLKGQRLLPLSSLEIERMVDMYASGPLVYTGATLEVDLSLIRKGWLRRYDAQEALEPSDRAYRRNEMGNVIRGILYDDNGSIMECWKMPNSSKRTIDVDQLCQMISEVLSQADGEWIAEIANKVMTQKVTYVGDSNFEIEGDSP